MNRIVGDLAVKSLLMIGVLLVPAGWPIACLSQGAGRGEIRESVPHEAADSTRETGPAQVRERAQETPSESLRVYQVDEIVVTGTRLSADQDLFFSTVTVASHRDLMELASSSPGEALATDSGTNLITYGSYGSLRTLSLRGGSSREVAYLLDGVPISDPQLGVMDLNWLPMSGTDRVEAMKGGASPIYGSGAISGAVNLISLDALSDMPSSQISAWTGSFASKSVSASLRRALQGSLGVVAAYDHLSSGGWIENSAYEGEKFYGKFAGRAGGNSRFDVMGFTHRARIEVPGAFPGIERDRRAFFKAGLYGDAESSFRVDFYHMDSRQSFDWSGYAYEHEGKLNGIQAEVYERRDGETSSIGIELRRKQADSNSIGRRRSGAMSVFVQREVTTPRLRASGRLRIEKDSQFRFEPAPALAVWYFAGGGTFLFARVDRSFMFPSFDDLYWRGPNEEGDPALKTEHSSGLEVGLLLDRGQVNLGFSVYARDVEDMILWRADDSCSPLRSINTAARLSGVETSLEFSSMHGLDGALSYSLCRARDRAGRELEYRPSNILAWTLRATRSLSKHVAGGMVFSGRHVSGVSAGNQMDYSEGICHRDESLPHYTYVLLYGYVAVDRGRLFARVMNAFDGTVYSTWGRPELPGRSFEFGVSLELRD